jgi:enoyl-CoA hydratase/carnithine racemase
MVLLGRKIKGSEAEKIGLVNKTVAPEAVMDTAREMAERLCKMPGIALGLAKKAIAEGLNTTLDQGKSHEKQLFSLAFSTPDQKEGMRSFLEKRKPSYGHTW